MPLFETRLVPSLPPLAWLYWMQRGSRPKLFHGKSVEILPNGFFEGCFAGHWLTDNFANCSEVFGSGLRIENGDHHFVSPSHTLEALFTLSGNNELAASNSLCFLLEFFELTLPVDLHYGPRFASAVLGIDAYEKNLSSTGAGCISRVLYDNLTVTPDLTTSHTRKPLGPPFTDYDSYVQYLTSTLKSAFVNASFIERKVRFSPLATCSTGYDSAASAAIAGQLGCRGAITLTTSRGGGVDSGRPVGEALGLAVSELERRQNVESFEDLAEFLATGMGGEDYCYLDFSSFVRRRILLTGFHGDKVWDLHAKPNAVIARGDISGSSLQEFRLNRDFINIPVPMIGARRHSEIVAISHSEEMIPYRLNGHYDRPIPRRLLEESGVARGLFGQEKKAASILFFLRPGSVPPLARQIRKALVPLSAEAHTKFLLRLLIWQTRWFLWRLINKAGAIFPAVRNLSKWVIRDWRIFEHHHPKAVLHFLGGLAITRRRYSGAGYARKTVRP
jgi:hypothetical protein